MIRPGRLSPEISSHSRGPSFRAVIKSTGLSDPVFSDYDPRIEPAKSGNGFVFYQPVKGILSDHPNFLIGIYYLYQHGSSC
nr:hypothetical protein [Geobacter sp. OR-1]